MSFERTRLLRIVLAGASAFVVVALGRGGESTAEPSPSWFEDLPEPAPLTGQGSGETEGTSSDEPSFEHASERGASFEDVFLRQVHAFYHDLLDAHPVPERRARRIAVRAVEAAFQHRIPPALVFGVMHTENDAFDPRARGPVDEIGLMQIRPTIWLPELRGLYGSDLEDEATNILYGVTILRRYADKSGGQWRETLLRYNGWGPQYPGRVRRSVEEEARRLCPSGSFLECAARPLDRWTHL